jgi:predicted DNA-binding transcriptional regulator AlpA
MNPIHKLPQPEELTGIPPKEVPHLLAQLATLQTILLSRLLVAHPTNGDSYPAEPDGDRLLSAKEAGAILGVSERWLYRRSSKLPFARRLSRKVLRFSETGLRKWQAQKRA